MVGSVSSVLTNCLKNSALFRIVDDFFPFALIRIHQVLHLLFEFFANAEAVVNDDVAERLDAAFHLVEPDGGARQAVGRLNVVHQEAVDVLDASLFIDVRREQVGVTRLGAAVAADIEVPALFRGDDAEILALRLRAFADAS